MEQFPRIPRWLSVTVASASAGLLVVGSAITDGVSGWWLVGWLVLAGGFAAAAIGLPQLQQWQAEQDARLHVQVAFDPPEPTVAPFGAGADPVIAAWLERAEDRCLTSLRSEQSPARDALMDPAFDREDDPLEGLNLDDLRRLAEKQASGEVLTDEEERTLDAYKRTTQYLVKGIGQSLSQLMAQATTIPDDRTPEQYRDQVANYIAVSEERMRAHLRWRYAVEGIGRLHTALINPTDRVYEEVQVGLYLPGNVRAIYPEGLSKPLDGMPNPPRPFGSRKGLQGFGLHVPSLSTPLLSTLDLSLGGPEIDNSASAHIRFEPVTLRPHARIELDPIALVVDEPQGSSIIGTWHATATNVPGRAESQLEIRVANEPLDAVTLLTGLLDDE